jgi:5-methylcytosine-specific restriction endonuclease McrA
MKIITSRTDCGYCHTPFTEVNRPTKDRKDTSKNYSVENVVLACRDCNVVKNAVLTYEEMLIIGPMIAELKANRPQIV